jgi:phosphatidylglycerophosphate synthase
VLTALRVPLAALLWLAPGNPSWFLAILAIGALSDMLDGVLARALDRDMSGDPKHIGSWLDPVCDKIFATSCIAAAYSFYDPPPALAALLLLREAFQLPLLVVYLATWLPSGRHASLASVPAGKATTVLQFCALVAIVFRSPVLWLLAPVVAIMGAFAVIAFLKRAYATARTAAS